MRAGIVLAVALLLALPVLNWLQDQIDATMVQEHLDQPVVSDAGPGLQVAALLLGPFRTVAADMVWNHAAVLMDERRYRQLGGIYEMIAVLQPYFHEAWIFNSYNMAYNISLALEDRERRWHWLRLGLRYAQRGSQSLPRAWQIHEWLALLYWHRIQIVEPDLEALLVRDAEIDPDGLGAVDLAERELRIARTFSEHTALTDRFFSRVLLHQLEAKRRGGDAGGEAYYRAEIDEVIEHLRSSHGPEAGYFAEELEKARKP